MSVKSWPGFVLSVLKSGSLIAALNKINFIPGTNVTIDVAQNGDRVDVTISSTGSGGSGAYSEVNTFADLPAASGHSGEIYVVKTGTGVWLVNRKESGLYLSDGSNWNKLNNFLTAFNDANFKVYNNSDNTKQVAFGTSGITTGTTRTATWPDKDGTVAMLSDVTAMTKWDKLAIIGAVRSGR